MERGDGDDEEGPSVVKKFKLSDPAESVNYGSMTSSHTVIAVFDEISEWLLCYEPSSKLWYPIKEFTSDMKQRHFTSVIVDDHIYVLMENKSVYRLKYSEVNATWQPMSSMSEQHGSCPPAATLNGSIYVCGTSDFQLQPTKCSVFHPSTNEWNSMADLEKTRFDPSVVAAKALLYDVTLGYIYCIGGLTDDEVEYTDLDSVERYDPHADSWSPVAPMKQPRSRAAAVEFNDKIYVMGGVHELLDPLSDVECYDPVNDTWTSLPPMLTPCGKCTACVLDEKIFIFKKFVSEQGLQTFDFLKNEWEYIDEVLGIKTYSSVNSLILPDHSKLVPVRKQKSSEIPRIPEVRAVKENALIVVSWEKAETISGYFVQVFCDGEEIESSTTKDPKFIFRNPEPSKDYYFRVCAQNRLHSYGEFTQSNVIKTCLSNVTASKMEGDIKVSWKPHDVSNEDLIHVQAFCDGKELGGIQVASDSQYFFKSAVRYKTYYFQVWIHAASGDDGEKIQSNEVGMLAYLGKGVYYDVNSPLRKGYKVYHGELEGCEVEKVAVKLLDYEVNPESKREIKHMIKVIIHPNTVLYRLSGNVTATTGETITFIAMELCEMKTLLELVEQESSFSDNYWKTALLQITHSIKHIHDHDVLHRDLKPQNILRSVDRKNMKLADFGLSKEMDPNKSMMSKSRIEIGTDGWGSRENYIKDEKMSKKSDVFSLGLIFHYVLSSGKHAFGPHSYRWKSNIIENTGKNLESVRCPDAGIAKDLIGDMLEAEPEIRPTVDEVLMHPFFWNDEHKSDFFCNVSDFLIGSTGVTEALEGRSSELECTNWLGKMVLTEEERSLIENQEGQGPVYVTASEMFGKGQNRKFRYNDSSVCDLLRFIRNLCHHFEDEGAEMKMIFKNLGDIWRFFSPRFPKLFPAVYRAMKGTPAFKKWPTEIALNKLLPNEQTDSQ